MFSVNKGLAYDGYSDKWLAETQRYDLLLDWWNQETIISLPKNIF